MLPGNGPETYLPAGPGLLLSGSSFSADGEKLPGTPAQGEVPLHEGKALRDRISFSVN